MKAAVSARRFRIPALALAAVLLIGWAFSAAVRAAAVPSIFLNDERWYRDGVAGAIVSDGTLYVPLDVFEMFRKVGLSVDTDNDEFMAYNRETRLYISVLVNESIAMVNGVEYTDLVFFRQHDCYYVPAEFFCSVLGLDCEDVPSASACGRTIRIFDGSQTKTLPELILDYTDALPTSAQPPATSEPVPTTHDDSEHTLYFLFHSVAPDAADELIAVLNEYGVSACFFFTEPELRSAPAAVSSLITYRHTLGVNADRWGDADDYIINLDSAGEALFGITKTKSRLTYDRSGRNARFSAEEADYVASYGYAFLIPTVETVDLEGRRDPVASILSACRTAAQRDKTVVFGMPGDEITLNVLRVLLPELQEKPNNSFGAPADLLP